MEEGYIHIYTAVVYSFIDSISLFFLVLFRACLHVRAIFTLRQVVDTKSPVGYIDRGPGTIREFWSACRALILISGRWQARRFPWVLYSTGLILSRTCREFVVFFFPHECEGLIRYSKLQ